MKTKFNLLAIPVTLLLCLSTMTNVEAAKTPIQQNQKKISSSTKAKVTSINYDTREVTLQTPDGETKKVVAGEDIKNLNDVKKGDMVHVEATAALAYEIHKGGKASAPKESTTTTAAIKGATPAGSKEREVTASFVISAIDKKTPAVTVKNVDGEKTTFKVMHPEKLKGVSVGDQVDITYTEAMALRVDKEKSKM